MHLRQKQYEMNRKPGYMNPLCNDRLWHGTMRHWHTIKHCRVINDVSEQSAAHLLCILHNSVLAHTFTHHTETSLPLHKYNLSFSIHKKGEGVVRWFPLSFLVVFQLLYLVSFYIYLVLFTLSPLSLLLL